MAHYIVTAKLKENKLDELKQKLTEKAFVSMKPFGKALTYSLENAKVSDDGYITWEELDYCSPPLKQERAAVLDDYFVNINVEPVEKGAGWKKISELPRLFQSIGE